MKKKIIRITTVPISLAVLLKGQLKYMSEHYEVIGVSSKDKFLKVVENQEGIKTHGINMTRSISPLKDLKAAFILYKYLKKEKPSIVHTHTPKAGTLGMLAALFAGVPHRLHTIAGLPLLEATGAKRKLLNFVEKITYSCATLILPNSFAMRDIILKEKFCSTKKLKVIANGSSNGIDVDHYKVDNVSTKEKNDLIKKFSIKAQDTVFIFIGRIVKDKGINELITALNEISKTNDNVKLIIVGPSEKELDPIDPNTEELIANHNNIYTTGLVEDIRPYVAISDVLTFPSYREGFPNVVLQANCMGIPCIVSDINGCNEIITHGHNGLIIPPKNSKALKTAMLDIINSPNLVNTLAQNSRQNIVNKYRREFIWEELLTLYNNLNDEKTI